MPWFAATHLNSVPHYFPSIVDWMLLETDCASLVQALGTAFRTLSRLSQWFRRTLDRSIAVHYRWKWRDAAAPSGSYRARIAKLLSRSGSFSAEETMCKGPRFTYQIARSYQQLNPSLELYLWRIWCYRSFSCRNPGCIIDKCPAEFLFRGLGPSTSLKLVWDNYLRYLCAPTAHRNLSTIHL
jgi:hypothetical protein